MWIFVMKIIINLDFESVLQLLLFHLAVAKLPSLQTQHESFVALILHPMRPPFKRVPSVHASTWSMTHSSLCCSCSLVACRSAGRLLLAPSSCRHRNADCCSGDRQVISTPFSSVSTSAFSSSATCTVIPSWMP